MNRTPSGIILPTFPERIIKTRSGKEKKVEYKIIAGSLKATNDAQGSVEGYLNAIGNIDYGNDRTMPGAFKRTLDLSYKRKKANSDQFLWPYLWNHDTNLLPPGGIFDADEDAKGLFIKAQLNLDYQLGRDMYSSYKFGSLKKQSMGYLAHQTEYTREDGQLVRDLLEVEILEGSGVIFPMNDESDVTDVKSAERAQRFWQGASLKSASGKTTWPLAPDDTKWDGGQATKDIEAWADGDWSKVAQCFFWVASSPPKTLDDCKLPFVAKVNGKMQAVPRGIIACTGSHGLDAVDIPDVDIPGVKKKIASYYKKMKMTPPWESSDSGKTRGRRLMDKKDFNDRYRQQCISDWQYDDWQALVIALKQSVMDAFASGDEPELDLVDIILNDADDSPGFISALKDYVQRGIDLDYSNYLQEQQSSGGYGDSYYGYMSRNNPARKSGASFSQANTDAIHGHVAALHDMADAQAKAMHDAADGLLEALQGLGAPSDPSYRQQGTTTDDEKSFRRATRRRKAGAEYSADNLQMLGEHIGDLHDVADTIHQMAEDLAENTGAQTYSDSDGNPDDASETDKNKANSRLDALGRKHSPAIGTAVDAGDVHTALSRLNNLTIVK